MSSFGSKGNTLDISAGIHMCPKKYLKDNEGSGQHDYSGGKQVGEICDPLPPLTPPVGNPWPYTIVLAWRVTGFDNGPERTAHQL